MDLNLVKCNILPSTPGLCHPIKNKGSAVIFLPSLKCSFGKVPLQEMLERNPTVSPWMLPAGGVPARLSLGLSLKHNVSPAAAAAHKSSGFFVLIRLTRVHTQQTALLRLLTLRNGED